GVEGGHGQLAEARRERGRYRRRAHQPRLALGVLRRVVVPLALVYDLAGQGRLRVVVAEHADLDLPRAADSALDDELAVVAGRLEQSLEGAVLTVRAVQRDEDDVEALAQLARHAAGRLGAHERRGGGAAHALGAVGQRLLDRARVVAAGQRPARLLGQRAHRIAADDPAAVARDADGNDLVTAPLERGDDGGGGGQRDLVLAGASAEDHAHARHERIVAVRLRRA